MSKSTKKLLKRQSSDLGLAKGAFRRMKKDYNKSSWLDKTALLADIRKA